MLGTDIRIESPVRTIRSKVECSNGKTFTYDDNLRSYTIERTGDNTKFFGYGVPHRLNVKLLDVERLLDFTTADTLTVFIGVDEEYSSPFPQFKISEVHRDENTNELSITAYDALYQASYHTISEITLEGYKINKLLMECAKLIGITVVGIDFGAKDVFSLEYENGANFAGTETIREVFDAVAEVTQTIYYINNHNALQFRRLDAIGDSKLTIGKDDYISLDSKTNRKLGAICHTTELGDNVIDSIDTFKFTKQPVSIAAAVGETITFTCAARNAVSYRWYNKNVNEEVWNKSSLEGSLTSTITIPVIASRYNYEWKCVITDKNGETLDSNGVFIINPSGEQYEPTSYTPLVEEKILSTVQYIRNNPFYEMRDDINELLANAVNDVCGLKINQFVCDWRGNYLLEIGDKINLVTKDDKVVTAYFTDDTLSYDGSLSQKTQWSYAGSDIETATNPSTLGDALKNTTARVDKVNQEIALLASTADENNQAITSLRLNTESISASVEAVRQGTEEALDNLNESVATITNKVETQLTSEEVQLSIQTALENGVNKVITTTGFTLNETGLTVSKSDSEMETTITEDGMKVYKNGAAVLTADNIGVEAVNLNAKTYLIIGSNSRFEDYGSNRTGCFWIGG